MPSSNKVARLEKQFGKNGNLINQILLKVVRIFLNLIRQSVYIAITFFTFNHHY